MIQINPRLEAGWLDALHSEFQQEYFIALKQFLLEEKRLYKIYPPGDRIFAAFDFTPFDNVKVVLLGQDPYHGEGQAHGLCFSVPQGVKPPPSLVNIFQELQNDLGIAPPAHGNLEKWAQQGVLLLNATLTVRANLAGSHQKKGWENFTDAVIRTLSEQKEHLVFLLWGNYAQAKEALIDTSRHAVLKAAHPSPFSVYRGFYGCRHFSRTNELLAGYGKTPIDWNLN
ncbi:MAG TPA: uracil-DNA glycosylase [Bacteroidales bacterium]|jgi:uracil-DNA glycosylase|nr:uracil-DNA glycosylase [Bacteroidales bacterium]